MRSHGLVAHEGTKGNTVQQDYTGYWIVGVSVGWHLNLVSERCHIRSQALSKTILFRGSLEIKRQVVLVGLHIDSAVRRDSTTRTPNDHGISRSTSYSSAEWRYYQQHALPSLPRHSIIQTREERRIT